MGIFFEGGGGDDLVDMGNKMPGHLFNCAKFVFGSMKPALRDIQKARADAAMQRAINEMQENIQPPDSPSANPLAQSNTLAMPDLSPPPTKKR